MAIKDDMEDVQEAVINELITENGITNTLADNQVTETKILNGAVTAAKLGSDVSLTVADGAVTPAKLSQAYLPLTGGSVSGNVTFGDNDKAIFGAGSDLQIYHTGTDSVIQEAVNNRRFLIAGDEIAIRKGDLSENMAKFNADGAVELYHNNSKKIETTSSGISVTGNATFAGLISAGPFGGAGNAVIAGSSSPSYTNQAGTNLLLKSGDGSGTGSSFISFSTSPAGSSGTTVNTATERMRINSQGHVILSNVPTSSANLATGTIYSDGGTLKIV